MRLIPVIDILNRVVVRGVAGQRDQYRPIQSPLTDSVDPLTMALAIRAKFGFEELYVADLDAITRKQPDLAIYEALRNHGFRLWIDAGIASTAAARELVDLGVERVIVGLESCPGPDSLGEILLSLPLDRVVFSLDLKEGVPLGSSAWGTLPLEIARVVIEAGVTQLIVLDLAAVGVGRGVPTTELCQQIRGLARGVEIVTGGGLRDDRDLTHLEQAGVDGVLVASALHSQETWLTKLPFSDLL
jgi:phosphoribosylformimino-5-aminoimidazole carboxamide ribotide isomerase